MSAPKRRGAALRAVKLALALGLVIYVVAAAPVGALALSLAVFGLAILMAAIGGVGELRRLVVRRPARPAERPSARHLLKPHP